MSNTNSFCFGLWILIFCFSDLQRSSFVCIEVQHALFFWPWATEDLGAGPTERLLLPKAAERQEVDYNLRTLIIQSKTHSTAISHLSITLSDFRVSARRTRLKGRERLHYTYEKEQGSKSNSLLKKRGVIAFLYSLSLFLTLSQSVACAHYLSAHLGSHFERTKINPWYS